MRYNSLIKRRSPSESPLREDYDSNNSTGTSIATNSSRNRHRHPRHPRHHHHHPRHHRSKHHHSKHRSIGTSTSSTNLASGGGGCGSSYPLPPSVTPPMNTINDNMNYINSEMDASSRCHSGPRQRPRPISSSRRCSSANTNNGTTTTTTTTMSKKRHRSKLNHANGTNANHSGSHTAIHNPALYHSQANSYVHPNAHSNDQPHPHNGYSSSGDYTSSILPSSTAILSAKNSNGNRNAIPSSTSYNSLSLTSAQSSSLHPSFSTPHLLFLAQGSNQNSHYHHHQQQQQHHHQQQQQQEETYDDGEEYYTSNKMSKPLRGNNNNFSNLDHFKFRNWMPLLRNFYHTQCHQWMQKNNTSDGNTNSNITNNGSCKIEMKKQIRRKKINLKNSNRIIQPHNHHDYECNMNQTSINNNTSSTYYKSGTDMNSNSNNNNNNNHGNFSVASSSSSCTSSLSSSSSPTYNNNSNNLNNNSNNNNNSSSNNDNGDNNTSSSYIPSQQLTSLLPLPTPSSNRGYNYENNNHNSNSSIYNTYNTYNTSSNQKRQKYTMKYYIKRYLQIFSCLFMLHLMFVYIYNGYQIPNTCHVAQLSKEKLNLLHWIGRDVNYIIVQDDALPSLPSDNGDMADMDYMDYIDYVESEDSGSVAVNNATATIAPTTIATIPATNTRKKESSSSSSSSSNSSGKDKNDRDSINENERKMKKNTKVQNENKLENEYKNKKQIPKSNGGGKMSLDNMTSKIPSSQQLRKKSKFDNLIPKSNSKTLSNPKTKPSNQKQKQTYPKTEIQKSETKYKTKNSSISESVKKVPFVPVLSKLIHHQWKDSTIPLIFNNWYNQWKSLFPEPEYTHILWTDESARDLIKKHYSWFLETYDSYDMNIKRADASRYFILHHMGGIYADLDYEPLINFYDYLPQNQVGLIESPYLYNEKIQNSLMTSPKGDPFWIHVFKGLTENAEMSVLHATGPVFLNMMMDTSKHPVYTLPCENFHRIPYGELENSKWTAILVRELVTRIVPMSKHCGYIDQENSCQFGKHHNTAAWTTESLF